MAWSGSREKQSRGTEEINTVNSVRLTVRANHQLFGMTKPSLKSGTNVLGVALNVDQRQVARESLEAVENREEAE